MVNRQVNGAQIILLGIILIAFALRVWGLGDLLLWGDSAYSAYVARQSLADITWSRMQDGHPPLYYYLLHWWISLLGQSEFSLRLPSAAFGVLTVPLAHTVGRRLAGRWVALGSALLVATSPMLIYYSRLPRMYSLAPFLALLSLYFLHQALDRGRWYWLAYFGASLAALYTHYYALLLLAGQGVYVLLLLKQERRHLRPWLSAQVGLALAYGPWLAFAARTQAEVTAGIISNAPAAQGLTGFVGQIWLPFHVGVTMETGPAWLLAGVFLAAIALGGVGWWQRGHSGPTLALSLIISLAVAIVLSYFIFLVVPYAVRTRFFVLWLPGYLALLAWLMGQTHHLRRWLPAAAIAIILFVNGYALQDSYFVERHIQEPDSIMLTDYLQEAAQPGDAVVFHAFWQIGYFTTHFKGQPPALYTLAQAMADPSLLEGHRQVWLSMYGASRGDPRYPLEEKLDRDWHKAQEIDFGPNRLSLYSHPLPPSQGRADLGSLLGTNGQPRLLLEDAQIESGPFTPGQTVHLNLGWRALVSQSEPLTFFLQLVDSRGNRLASRDAEPSWGANPASGWQAGELYFDHPALLLPADLPRGQYTIAAGFYPSGSEGGPRLKAIGSFAREDGSLALGAIEVQPRPDEAASPPHRLEAQMRPGLGLLGYGIDLDAYAVASQKEILPAQGEIIGLTFPRQSYRPGDKVEVSLFWQAQRPLEEDYVVSVQLATKGGQVIARDDNQPRSGSYPTYLWPPGDVVIDKHQLSLPDSLAPGEYVLRVAINDWNQATDDSLFLRRVRVGS